jgi:hypothetical protein
MLLSEMINDVLTRSGVTPTDKDLIALVANPSLQIEVPDAISSTVNSLVSIEQAKNHPALKSHYYGASLTPVEKELEKTMDELGFTDDQKASVLSTKTTYEKFPIMREKINEIIQERAKASGSGSQKAADEIKVLNAKLAEMTTVHQSEVANIRNEYIREKTEDKLAAMMAGYSYTDAIPATIAPITAKNLLADELSKVKAKIKLDNGSLSLVSSDDESIGYFENNKPVTLKDFMDRTVSPLLKKNDNSGNGGQGNGGGQHTNNHVVDMINADIQSLRASKV